MPGARESQRRRRVANGGRSPALLFEEEEEKGRRRGGRRGIAFRGRAELGDVRAVRLLCRVWDGNVKEGMHPTHEPRGFFFLHRFYML